MSFCTQAYKSHAHFAWTTIGFTKNLSVDCHHKDHIVLSRKAPLQQQFDGEKDKQTDRRMNRDRWKDKQMDEQMDRRMNRDRRKDKQTDRWMNRQMDGKMNRRTEG